MESYLPLLIATVFVKTSAGESAGLVPLHGRLENPRGRDRHGAATSFVLPLFAARAISSITC
jgi:hypothetical protein